MAAVHFRNIHRIEPLESRRLLSSYFLDPSFGQNGLATIGSAAATGFDTVLVTEVAGGKILAVGQVSSAGNPSHVAAARFNADGTTDTSFGTGGAAISFAMASVSAAALDQDGNIVVLGARVSGGDVFVARFTPAFVLDTQFGGGDGVIDFDGGTGNPFLAPNYLAIGADNSVVVAGTVEPPGDDQIGVVRLTPDGELDTDFVGDGSIVLDRPYLLHVRGLAVQDDGRIIVCGSDGTIPMVARITATGAMDSDFASDRDQLVDGMGHYPEIGIGFIVNATVQPDGRILISTSDEIGRLTSQGEFDTTFSGDGIAEFAGNVEWGVLQFRIDPGTGRITALTQNGIMKYLANGEVDPSFVEDGTIPWIINPNTGITPDVRWLAEEDGAFGSIYDVPRLTVSKYVPRTTSLDGQGRLSVGGTAANDTIRLEAVGNQARLTRNGDVTVYPLAQVLSFEVRAGDGDNAITVLLDIPTTIETGSGDDTITTGDGLDEINAGDGNNLVSTADGGVSEWEVVTTGSGNDTIIGSDGKHNISSGAGNDSITTGDGDDGISAGEGYDIVNAGGGADSITSGESVNGGDGDDRIFGDGGADWLDGGPGNDRIYGRAGANTILGGDGDDSLSGMEGADSLVGGAGNDTIIGGHGANTVFAGAGNDSVRGGDGNDWFWGESGYDTMKGGFGNDFLHGGNGKDRLFGQEGNDRLYGSGNDDALDGGAGRDLLVGGDGNDKLWAGDNERDTVNGGDGADLSAVDSILDDILNVETIAT